VPEGGYNEDIYLGDLVNDSLVNIRRLTADPGQDLAPTWSPDGRQIAFVTHRDRDTAIYLMNTDGTNQRRLTINLAYAHWPDWCSNGKIIFNDLDGIASINPDGTGFTRIINDASADQSSCSPDGSKISFETNRDGNWEVYTANIDGSNQRNLTNNLATDGQPAWSPDGTKILFMSDLSTPGQELELDLYSINLDGTENQRLTSAPGRELDASWSLDGSKISFARFRFFMDPSQIYLMNSNGTNWVQLTFDGASRYPAWRPRQR
jgi:Tol biopolymer transport system component